MDIPSATGFHEIERICLIFIPVSISDCEETWNDEASTDDFNDEEVDEDDVQKVEFSPNQQ